MGGCPPPCPPVTPLPPDGTLPESALAGAGRAAVRRLRARAVLHGPLRLLRLQHLHRRRSSGTRPARPGRRTPRRRSPSCGRPAGCSATGTSRSPRCSSAAVRRPCCRPSDLAAMLAAVDAEFGLAAGCRGHHRVQPRQRHARRPGPAAGGRIHPDLLRDAVRGPARAGDPRPDPRPAARARRRGVGAGGRLRAGQPGPDLRHAGGVVRPTGRPRSTPHSPAAPTTSRRTR